MDDVDDLRRAYDEQLRTDAETPSAISVTMLDDLRLVTFAGGRGFITYPHLTGIDIGTTREAVEQALAHYARDPEITTVEWKSRGHDEIDGLHDVLVEHGFDPGEPESIMIGEARLLDVEVPLPDGVSLRQVTAAADVSAMCAMQAEAFGDDGHDGHDEDTATALLSRLARRDGMQLWVAEAGGAIISAGRLEPVANSEFAGIWGGATLEPWRGRGIYRALTAARARAAIAMGKRLMNSDSTEYSRPILERSGFRKVSTTTPYTWRR